MNKTIFLSLLILISIFASGCTTQVQDSSDNSQISDESDTGNMNNPQDSGNSGSSTDSTSVPVQNTNLPDVVLKDLKIYDQALKRYIELNEPITASNPIEMTIIVKNQGNAPYVDAKGNAPIIVTMITEAYPSNLYFYSNNYSALNPGDERVYKTNWNKYRDLGTFDVRIFPSIQYITDQPEELNKENNEMSLQLTVKAK
ncbi:MAG TPA: hypothetical protein VEC16_02095 [Alphaproteobacteria bacterium]|nr:hypothetical protein [Alphaproteobacteria bacterium]